MEEVTQNSEKSTLDTKPTAQVVGVSGIQSEEKILTGEQESRKINPKVFKEYQKLQQKYLSVYGKQMIRNNLKRKMRLASRLQFMQEKLKELEKNLYLVD